MKISSVVFFGILMSAMMVAGSPVEQQQHRRQQPSKGTYDPEAPAIDANGPLPSNVDTVDGMARNASSYPSSVAKAMERHADGVRSATDTETQTWMYYTALSADVYCRTVIPGGSWDCPHCSAVSGLNITRTFSTPVTDTNVLVAVDTKGRTIHVAFRGTNSIRNLGVDLEFELVDYPPVNGAKVDRGFLKSYKEVKTELVKEVEAQADLYPGYTIVLSGHSLGGALAVLFALDLHTLGYNKLLIYTQGQPRVGNAVFANYVVNTKIPYRRLISKRDVVPHLPPSSWGFLHAGQEFWIVHDRPTTIRVCPDGIETTKCSNSIVPYTKVFDHFTYLGMDTGFCLNASNVEFLEGVSL